MTVPLSPRDDKGNAACPRCGSFAMDVADQSLLCDSCGWCTWPLAVEGNNLLCDACHGDCCIWRTKDEDPGGSRWFHIDAAHHVCPSCSPDSPANAMTYEEAVPTIDLPTFCAAARAFGGVQITGFVPLPDGAVEGQTIEPWTATLSDDGEVNVIAKGRAVTISRPPEGFHSLWIGTHARLEDALQAATSLLGRQIYEVRKP